MEYRPLNISVMSAEGLKNVTMFSKMDVYAVVSIVSCPRSRQTTSVDKHSSSNPEWNHRMEFIIDEPYLTRPGCRLHFQLKAKKTFCSSEIGSITVPIHELFEPNYSVERFVQYQVCTTSGKPKGSLKFSYRFGDKFTENGDGKRHTVAAGPVTAYPAAPSYGYMGYPSPSTTPPPPMGYDHGYGYGAYNPQTHGYYGYHHESPPPQPPSYAYPLPPPYVVQQQKDNGKRMEVGMVGAGAGLGVGA